MAKRVADSSPQTRITRRRIICAQTAFPSVHQRDASRIRGVGCAHCSPTAGSDSMPLTFSARGSKTFAQKGASGRLGFKNLDPVLADWRHTRCRSMAVCRMECLVGRGGKKQPDQPVEDGSSRPDPVSIDSGNERQVLRKAAEPAPRSRHSAKRPISGHQASPRAS